MARKTALSDDPLENIVHWLQQHVRTVSITAGAVVVAAAAIWVYRASEASKRERASTALYAAQAPLMEGNTPAALAELQKVVQRYGSTSSGQQAVLLVAQVHYNQGQFAEGIAALEGARGSASREFAASMDALIAAGHESQGAFDKSAEFYRKAASEAVHDVERMQYETFEARALMTAGDPGAARVIWEKLATDESKAFALEARIRLGELIGAGK